MLKCATLNCGSPASYIWEGFSLCTDCFLLADTWHTLMPPGYCAPVEMMNVLSHVQAIIDPNLEMTSEEAIKKAIEDLRPEHDG